MDHNQQGQGQGRRHFHRGRRGPDRRGPDRRGPQAPTPEQASSRNDVDVEQIMRDIRSRIAQRHGIELTNQQIQELAARRLESILDPRSVKPALLDQLRRAAGTPPDTTAPASADAPYSFEEATLYDSHRGLMRFIRKLLNPILKLFFNPNPLIRALNIQARLNTESLAREAERERRQAEWNALHYEILHRVVTEIARVTLEVQSLSMRVESLAAKVDFNERRVRGIEGAMHQARPAGRREEGRRDEGRRDIQETPLPPQVVVQAAEVAATEPVAQGQGQAQPSEGTRRRRRRRRGRRGAGAPGDAIPGAADVTALDVDEPDDGADEDEAGGVLAELPPDPSTSLEAPRATSGGEGGSHGEPGEGGSDGDQNERQSDVAKVQSLGVVVEETVVVVAEAQPPVEEAVAVEPVVRELPAPPDTTAAQEPGAPAEEPGAAPPERRDLEPTDR